MTVHQVQHIGDDRTFPSGTLRLSFTSDVDGAEDWALFRPGAPDKPVLVYLHGSFSSGDQLYTRADIRDHFLPVFLREGLGLLTPNLRGTTYMCPKTVADTADLLDEVVQRFGAGQGFLFLGGSGGASSAQIFAVRHPDRVRGLIALGACDLVDRLNFARQSDQPVLQDLARAIITAYGGTPEEVPEVYVAHSVIAHADRLTMPFLLASGECDALIPVDKVREEAAALQHQPQFTYWEVPNGDHDSPLFLPVAEMLRLAGWEA
jgi:pimeloyl-ACP methyl ester carboxylesterase